MTITEEAPVDEPSPERAASTTDKGQRPRHSGVVAEVLAGLMYLVIRAWQSWGVPAMVFQDSIKNLESSHFGLLSKGLWFGQRTPLVPIVLHFTASSADHVGRFIAANVILGSVAFALLAATVGRALPGAFRWVAVSVILLTGLTTPITMWDHNILTESLSITSLVFTAVTGIWLVARPTWPRLVGFLIACTALVMVRDTHIVLTALIALGALAFVLLRWKRVSASRWMFAVTVVVLLGLTIFGRASTFEGGRQVQPTQNMLFVKILPYEDRFQWFADHGMPDADRLRALLPGVYPDGQTHTPLFPLPQMDDPNWKEFNHWVVNDANGVYTRWILTHPIEALSDPFRKPKMIWNSAGDSWVFYRNPHFKEFRLIDVDVLLFPPLGIVALIGAGATALLFSTHRRWWREPVGLVGWLLVVTGGIHSVVSYLGDPAEVSRHALVSIVQIRLGFLVIILLALPHVGQLGRRLRAVVSLDDK
jgi:hypothetical protein